MVNFKYYFYAVSFKIYQYKNRLKNKNPQVIQVKNKNELKRLIRRNRLLYGNHCDLNHIDTSQITDMSQLFKVEKILDIKKKTSIRKIDYIRYLVLSKIEVNISNWNTSQVTNMRYMFTSSKFNHDISVWNVSQVEDMSNMFNESQFNGNISQWDTSNVIDMRWMFFKSKFQGDISGGDVAQVKDMRSMFENSLFNGDISYWNIVSLENSEFMFQYCANPFIPPWANKKNRYDIELTISQRIYEKLDMLLEQKIEKSTKKLKI